MSRSNAVADVTQASKCRKCNEEACAEEHVDPAFYPLEVLLFACRKCPSRKVKCWYYCKTCSKRFNYNTLRDVNAHANRKGHVERKAAQSSSFNLRVATATATAPPTATPAAACVSQLPAFSPDIFENDTTMDLNFEMLTEDMSVLGAEDEVLMDVSLEVLGDNSANQENNQANNGVSNSNTKNQENTANNDRRNVSQCPLLNMEGNEWLAKEFQDTPKAASTDIDLVFSHPSVDKMKHFWGSERFCGSEEKQHALVGA